MISHKGFTLVELLVGVVVFSLIGAIASGVLVSGLRAQRKSLAYQELLDQTSFAMEYMSRSLRMARKELSAPACLSENGLNYEKTRGGKGLKFINYQGNCQEFFWDSNDDQFKEDKTGYVEPLPLTSSNLQITSFNIKLKGESQDDEDQPRATFFLEIEGKEESKISIQTTVSQRNPDIER